MKFNKKFIISLIIILGGIIMAFTLNYMQEKTHAEKIRETETNLAKYIVSEYKDVENISFEKWGYSKETGYWSVKVKVNNSNLIYYSFRDNTDINSMSGSNYHIDTFKLVEKEEMDDWHNILLSNVMVSHSKCRTKK